MSPSACWVIRRPGLQAGVSVQQHSTAQPICPRAAVEACELGSKHGLTFWGMTRRRRRRKENGYRYWYRYWDRYWYRYIFMQLMKIYRNEFLNQQNRLCKMNSTNSRSPLRVFPSPSPTSVTSPHPPRGVKKFETTHVTSLQARPTFPQQPRKILVRLALANTKRRLPAPSLGGGGIKLLEERLSRERNPCWLWWGSSPEDGTSSR